MSLIIKDLGFCGDSCTGLGLCTIMCVFMCCLRFVLFDVVYEHSPHENGFSPELTNNVK